MGNLDSIFHYHESFQSDEHRDIQMNQSRNHSLIFESHKEIDGDNTNCCYAHLDHFSPEHNYSISYEGKDCEEPPLYSLLCRGEENDWEAVILKLRRIGDALQFLQTHDHLEKNKMGKSEKNSKYHDDSARIGYNRIHKEREYSRYLFQILKEPRELFWKHPSTGATALHVAVCWNPPLEVIQQFISLNVDLYSIKLNILWERNFLGATPLHYACANAADKHICAALLYAIRSESATTSKDMYVLVQTYDTGFTPLHCAVNANASFDVMKLLVEINPYISIVKDRQGRTPLDIFLKKCSKLISQVISSKPDNFVDPSSIFSSQEEDNIDIDIPITLRKAINCATFSQQFSIDVIQDFWKKATLLLRAAASATSNSLLSSNFDESNSWKFSSNRYIIHAALSVPFDYGICPPRLLKFLLLSVPDQMMTTHGQHGDLPLHLAARVATTSIFLQDEDSRSNITKDKISAFTEILNICPTAAGVENSEGNLPLEVINLVIIENKENLVCKKMHSTSGKSFSFVQNLLCVNPGALEKLDIVEEIFPYLLFTISNLEFSRREALLPEEPSREANLDQRDFSFKTDKRLCQAEEKSKHLRLNTLYQLLRNRPQIMQQEYC